MQLLNPSSWGPSTHGHPVVINEIPNSLGPIVAIDIETDEQDKFVGGAIYDGSKLVYYFTDPVEYTKQLASRKIIGHNVKADLNWLRLLGLQISSNDLYGDTMIMSYVINSNRDSHGLKEVAKEILKLHWPSYRDMVGKGSKKQTLDKQAIEKVAEYCGMDTFATWKLHEYFTKNFNLAQRNLYDTVELPVYRMLWDMECQGICIDTTLLAQLDKEFGDEAIQAEAQLRAYSITWNPNSPKQTLEVLRQNGLVLAATDKPALVAHIGRPIVASLLAYRKIKKLHSTYVCGLRQVSTLPVIHTTFNQVAYQDDGSMKGIRTGRLSSNDPNLQNIPAKRKGETYGAKLRQLFVPRQGKVFIDADYSQIEYRLLAHFSQESKLVSGFHSGADVHDVTGKLLGCDRKVGKTLNFASIYGAQSGKIALTAGISESDAARFLAEYWQKLPQVRRWIDRTTLLAKGRGGVTTMSGRYIPLPDLQSKNRWKRAHAERAAINYIIQGSAADIIKVAMLELKKQGYTPILQVHDELVFECDPNTAAEDLKKIQYTMENVVKLTVPIKVDIHQGKNWNEAKGD